MSFTGNQASLRQGFEVGGHGVLRDVNERCEFTNRQAVGLMFYEQPKGVEPSVLGESGQS
jgi:hypothetical protein